MEQQIHAHLICLLVEPIPKSSQRVGVVERHVLDCNALSLILSAELILVEMFDFGSESSFEVRPRSIAVCRVKQTQGRTRRGIRSSSPQEIALIDKFRFASDAAKKKSFTPSLCLLQSDMHKDARDRDSFCSARKSLRLKALMLYS